MKSALCKCRFDQASPRPPVPALDACQPPVPPLSAHLLRMTNTLTLRQATATRARAAKASLNQLDPLEGGASCALGRGLAPCSRLVCAMRDCGTGTTRAACHRCPLLLITFDAQVRWMAPSGIPCWTSLTDGKKKGNSTYRRRSASSPAGVQKRRRGASGGPRYRILIEGTRARRMLECNQNVGC